MLMFLKNVFVVLGENVRIFKRRDDKLLFEFMLIYIMNL